MDRGPRGLRDRRGRWGPGHAGAGNCGQVSGAPGQSRSRNEPRPASSVPAVVKRWRTGSRSWAGCLCPADLDGVGGAIDGQGQLGAVAVRRAGRKQDSEKPGCPSSVHPAFPVGAKATARIRGCGWGWAGADAQRFDRDQAVVLVGRDAAAPHRLGVAGLGAPAGCDRRRSA